MDKIVIVLKNLISEPFPFFAKLLNRCLKEKFSPCQCMVFSRIPCFQEWWWMFILIEISAHQSFQCHHQNSCLLQKRKLLIISIEKFPEPKTVLISLLNIHCWYCNPLHRTTEEIIINSWRERSLCITQTPLRKCCTRVAMHTLQLCIWCFFAIINYLLRKSINVAVNGQSSEALNIIAGVYQNSLVLAAFCYITTIL